MSLQERANDRQDIICLPERRHMVGTGDCAYFLEVEADWDALGSPEDIRIGASQSRARHLADPESVDNVADSRDHRADEREQFMSTIRTRWAAIGAAVAITLGGGGVGLVAATQPDRASTLVLITPCRVIDTRPDSNVGPKASPLGPGETHTVAAHGDNGDCTGIPAEAVALSMNVTAVEATAPTFLTIWANGEPRPTTSSLNPAPGQPPTPNAVTTDLSSAGEFDIFNLAGNVHVLADINGYYTDHHHDDRYFGFGNTLRSADTSGGATSSSGVVSFPDVGSPTMSISFGLPPGRIDGRPILVQIPFRGPPNCTFVLSADGAAGPFNDSDRFLNTGWTVVDSPDSSVDLGPPPSGDSQSTVVVTLSHISASQLGAGASVEMNLRRVATSLNDTCAGTVRARGGYSVEY